MSRPVLLHVFLGLALCLAAVWSTAAAAELPEYAICVHAKGGGFRDGGCSEEASERADASNSSPGKKRQRPKAVFGHGVNDDPVQLVPMSRARTAAAGSTLDGVSPKDKRQLAREHLEAAQSAMIVERFNDAVNALFYAAEAAVVALADQHGIDTKKHHGRKADAASELHKKSVLAEDYGPSCGS